MSWDPPKDYKPRSDEDLQSIMKDMKHFPGRTSMRMMNIILSGKRPVLKHDAIDAEDGEEEVTPAQARYAFYKRWVPAKWVNTMTKIALDDGKDYWPPNED